MEVVNVSQQIGHALHRDVAEAVEALALLVTVQRIPATGEVRSSAIGDGHQYFIVRSNSEGYSRDFQLPSGLNQPPSGFDFVREISKLDPLSQPKQFIGQPDAAAVLAFVRVEPYRDCFSIHDMETVEDIIERQLCRLPDQFIFAELPLSKLLARFQEPTRRKRSLLGSLDKVLDNVPGERLGQVFQCQ
jgi:hypothetical protein